jgi:hypothetical protein
LPSWFPKPIGGMRADVILKCRSLHVTPQDPAAETRN